MNQPSRVLYITCSNGHRKRKIAKAVPREDFNDVFGEPHAVTSERKLFGTYTMTDGRAEPFTQEQTLAAMTLIWMNTAETKNLRNPAEMPSGSTDLDRKILVICSEKTCRRAVMATESTFRTRVYEPATRQGQIYMDIADLEAILTT